MNENEVINQKIWNAFASANYIIENLHKHGVRDLTNLKLQKLLYFAYGMHLAVYEEPLFESEIQAWRLGPVIPDVYNEFKDRGSMPISEGSRATIQLESINEKDYNCEIAEFISEKDYNFEIPEFKRSDSEIQTNKINSLYVACMIYGDEKAWKLVDRTHKENSAWYKSYDPSIKNKIKTDDIKEEFVNYVEKEGLVYIEDGKVKFKKIEK